MKCQCVQTNNNLLFMKLHAKELRSKERDFVTSYLNICIHRIIKQSVVGHQSRNPTFLGSVFYKIICRLTLFEPRRVKNVFLHMRKQRRRSASR